MAGALEGLKVLDLTRVLAGPFATMILADLGADVLKIELPKKGDDSRAFGPYINGESAYFMSINRNKRSMTLDLKSQEGREIFLDLLGEADILVENFRPGKMDKLGLGYEELSKINPRLIYASTSGFGQTGPYSERPAYDAVIQAMSGVMSITGQEGGRPTKLGPSLGDIIAGLYTSIGILASLEYRNRTGRGQRVDVAMLDSQVSILENAIARYMATGENPGPLGNRHASIVPFEDFKTGDGYLMLAAGNDNLFRELCQALELEDLVQDERFRTNQLRGENQEELREILRQAFREKPSQEWMEILNAKGIPNGPINKIGDLFENPQLRAREMLVDIDHKKAGRITIPGVAIKLSETPGTIKTPAPLLGENTEEILRDRYDLSQEAIDELKEKGII